MRAAEAKVSLCSQFGCAADAERGSCTRRRKIQKVRENAEENS